MTSTIFSAPRIAVIYSAVLISSLSLFGCNKSKGKFVRAKPHNPPNEVHALDESIPLGYYAFVYSPTNGAGNVIVPLEEDSEYAGAQLDGQGMRNDCSFLKDTIPFGMKK